MINIAVFVSGSGSNAEKIFEHFQGHGTIQVKLLISNNATAYGLERAKKWGIESKVITKDQFKDASFVLNTLKSFDIEYIALAGFLLLVPPYLNEAFPKKIINIHPALLPKFGGKGMYGMNVHKAVEAAGEKESGISIHVIDNEYDKGEMLLQKSCNVEGLKADEIAQSVLKLEHEYFAPTIEKLILS